MPASPLRLPRAGREGVARIREGVLQRVVHLDDAPVLLRAALPAPGRLVLGARGPDAAAAEAGLRRLRFWTAADDDLSPFLAAFAEDEEIGESVRDAPHLRPFRRPTPWEVLVQAVCEQLVTDEEALEIKRAVVRRLGRRDAATGLRDWPTPATLAGQPPAALEACGLAATRARALRRVAREVAAGRVDLEAAGKEALAAGWRRLRAVDGIGPWTVSVLALHGQGRHDALAAGDFAFRLLVGRVLTGSPHATATEADVVSHFERFRPWRGVAAFHALRLDARRRQDGR